MKKAVFIDRDGTIIKDKHYISKTSDVEFINKIDEMIRLFNKMNFLVIIVTNQSGIGRGFFTENDLKILHDYIQGELKKKNAKIDAFYYCPHFHGSAIKKYDVKCGCRKPEPGLLIQAAKDFDIDISQSYMIGDKFSDILTGKNAGLRKSFLVSTETSIIEIAKKIFEYECK